MIGINIEFKRWYLVIRGPKGRVYSAFGFAKQMPVFLPTHTTTLDQYLDDSGSAILADEWREDDETDDDELVFTTMDGEEILRI
jgi:hypothetical protein